MNHIYSWGTPEVIEARIFEHELAAARRLVIAHEAALQAQRTAAIALREREEYRKAAEKKTGGQGDAAFPTPDDPLVGVVK